MLCMLVYGLLLGCPAITHGSFIPYYNLSVTNHRNQTNQWLEMKIDHEDDQTWNTLLTHSKKSTAVKISQDNEMNGPKKSPPPGYQQACGLGYYKVYGKEAQTTWQKAEDQCESEGAHLIVIDTEQELLYMRMLAITYAKEGVYFFVGIHDLYKEGDYVTVLNKSMESTRYSTWYKGQPHSGTSANCAQFYYNLHTQEYGLDHLSCTYVKGFICEIESSE